MRKMFSMLVGAGAVVLALMFPLVSATARPYSEIYVFGDSLVDAGNISAVLPAAGPNPAAGYFDGRFTNGPVYTDLLYQSLFGTYMTPSMAGGTNYAFGGARTIDNSGVGIGRDIIPDLGAQLNLYAMASGNTADPDALYIINVMGNDVFAVARNETLGLSPLEYYQQVTATLISQIERLNDMGARHILVTGVPNGHMPEDALPLQLMVDEALAGLMLEANLMTFSYLDLFSRMQNDPTSLGLPEDLNLTTPCLLAKEPSPDIDCTGFLFFDTVHPTAAIHEILAREIAAIVGIGVVSVSEPAPLALVGIGFVGLALVRRRRA